MGKFEAIESGSGDVTATRHNDTIGPRKVPEERDPGALWEASYDVIGDDDGLYTIDP